MMTTFFESTENNGLANIRLHRQMDEGEFLEKIVVESKLARQKGVDPAFLEISVYSSMTLWELKYIIAQYLNQSPLNITLKRMDTKKVEFKDSRNCKLLSDLKVAGGEKI